MISRLIKGDQKWVSPDDLEKLARGISSKREEQAALLLARLRDECQGPGKELIELGLRGAGELREEPWQVPGTADLQKKFAVLADWYSRDQNVQEVIDGLYNLLTQGDCRI
jgi:hypothetical protein